MTKQIKEVVSVDAPKARKTLLSIQPHSHKIDLVHPTDSEIYFWVKIKSREANMDYLLRLFELNPTTDEDGNVSINMSSADQYKLMAELTSTAIEAWDEDGVGMAFSLDNAKEFLMNPVNAWVKTEIENALNEQSNFFTKA